MEELYKVMDDLLEVEFQMKAGMDILKELEEFYMLEKETEKSDARKVAVLMKGYLQSMKYQKLLNPQIVLHKYPQSFLKRPQVLIWKHLLLKKRPI